jgi:surface antigen
MDRPAVFSRLLVAALLVVPLPVSSFNLGFLHNAPASYFTEQDWKLVSGAVNQALDMSEEGQAVTWENPETGHLGTVTAVKTTRKEGAPCCELKIYNKVEKASAESYHRFCKQPDGSWKTVTP